MPRERKNIARDGARQDVHRIVRNALQREHGHVVKTRAVDPPSYKETPLITFKQRVNFESTAEALTVFDIDDIITGDVFREYKVLLVQAWAVARSEGATEGVLEQLKLKVTNGGETIVAQDVAGKNTHAVCAIRPPQDDFAVKGTSDVTFSVGTGAVVAAVIVDVLIQARLILPMVNYVPALHNIIIDDDNKQHSLCKKRTP